MRWIWIPSNAITQQRTDTIKKTLCDYYDFHKYSDPLFQAIKKLKWERIQFLTLIVHVCELWILNIVVVSRMYASVMALYALRYCVKRRKWQWTRYRAQPKLWVKWTLQQTHNLNIVLINLRFSISFVHKFTTSAACTTWSHQNEWIQNHLSACCRIGIGK